MSERLFLIDSRRHTGQLDWLGFQLVSSDEQMARSYSEHPRNSLWVALHAGCLSILRGVSRLPEGRATSRAFLSLERLGDARRVLLRERFDRVIEPGEGINLLPGGTP